MNPFGRVNFTVAGSPVHAVLDEANHNFALINTVSHQMAQKMVMGIQLDREGKSATQHLSQNHFFGVKFEARRISPLPQCVLWGRRKHFHTATQH